MLNETIYGSVRVGKTKQFKTAVNDMFENFYEKYNQTFHPGYVFPYNYFGLLNGENELYQLQTLNVHLNNVKPKSIKSESIYTYDKEELRKHFRRLLISDLKAKGTLNILPFYNKK